MDEVTHQMFLNLEDVMGTKWDYVQVQFMCFIILFAVVAAVCVITAIVTVLRKKQSEAIEVERENNAKLETINTELTQAKQAVEQALRSSQLCQPVQK